MTNTRETSEVDMLVENYPASTLLKQIRNNENIEIRHTNLQHAKRSEIEIAELLAATGETVVQPLITYPYGQLAYFETIAVLETEVKTDVKEDEIYDIVEKIYDDFVKPLNGDGEKKAKEIEDNANSRANDMVEFIRKTDNNENEYTFTNFPRPEISDPMFEKTLEMYFKIKGNISLPEANSNSYVPSQAFLNMKQISKEDAKFEVLKMYTSDKIYQTEIQNYTAQVVAEAVEKGITTCQNEQVLFQQHPLEKLSLHEGNERQTVVLVGAPACGKGTILNNVLTDLKNNKNIDSRDFVKINTDTHRKLVATNTKLPNDQKLHVSLNGDEANYISIRAYALMKEKLNKNNAPHMIIDGVAPTEERINLGTQNSGTVEMHVVTLAPDESLKRAYHRGVNEGRFVQSQYLLNSHASVSKNVYETVLLNDKYIGKSDKNITVTIHDNNVKKGEKPIEVAHVDLKNQTVKINDNDRLAEFRAKKTINVSGQSPDRFFSIAKGSRLQRSESSENLFKKTGYNVIQTPTIRHENQ